MDSRANSAPTSTVTFGWSLTLSVPPFPRQQGRIIIQASSEDEVFPGLGGKTTKAVKQLGFPGPDTWVSECRLPGREQMGRD